MKRILYVAAREFTSTVMTKGFVFGVLVTPAMIAVLIYVMPRMITKAPPKTAGRVAVIDPTGTVPAALADYLSPDRFAERRATEREKIERATPDAVRRQVATSPAGQQVLQQSVDAAMGEVPQLQVVTVEPGVSLEEAKTPS